MPLKHSKRAVILEEVLNYIDTDDWEYGDGFIIFGKEAFQLATGEIVDKVSGPDIGSTALSRLKVNRGDLAVAKRISLGTLPPDLTGDLLSEWVSELPDGIKEQLAESLSNALTSGALQSRAKSEDDALDAALARNALGNLDRAMARVATLDDVEVNSISVINSEYFEEAHWCDMAGLAIAAAVLCGAMLEAALKQKIDPRKIIEREAHENKRRGERGEPTSHVALMINRARELGILKDDRPEWAKKINRARNAAVHELHKFKKDFAPQITDLVDNWRKVLIDLYAEGQ